VSASSTPSSVPPAPAGTPSAPATDSSTPATAPSAPVAKAVTTADAKNRAWRTAVQGLLLDVSTAVVMVLATAVTDLRWTRDYWVTLGLLLAKTAIQSAVSYTARKLVPPATAT
jgi:hypothetical protein